MYTYVYIKTVIILIINYGIVFYLWKVFHFGGRISLSLKLHVESLINLGVGRVGLDPIWKECTISQLSPLEKIYGLNDYLVSERCGDVHTVTIIETTNTILKQKDIPRNGNADILIDRNISRKH